MKIKHLSLGILCIGLLLLSACDSLAPAPSDPHLTHSHSDESYIATRSATGFEIKHDGQVIIPSESMLQYVEDQFNLTENQNVNEIYFTAHTPDAVSKGLCINGRSYHDYALKSQYRYPNPHPVGVMNPSTRRIDWYDCYVTYSYYYCKYCGQEGTTWVSHSVPVPH